VHLTQKGRAFKPNCLLAASNFIISQREIRP
jgi:hypothetical protein